MAAKNGDEILEGRQATKLTLTPRPRIQPTSDGERDALQTTIQPWIDKADEHPVRLKREYLCDGIFMLRGGTVELFWQKMQTERIS